MPTVSIILPTYNREAFLPEAFAAIEGQEFTDWELIVVDDGSTDGTAELVPQLTAGFLQPVRYIYQENQGAYGARNTGLDHASGKYIAFYDSDDLWLPHHLRDCVAALQAHPDVDWVYGACRMVDHITGQEFATSTFYVDGRPRPFMSLAFRRHGVLRIIDDSQALKKVLGGSGLFSGLQNSVIRTTSLTTLRFDYEVRNEAEDQLFSILMLGAGRRFAYFDNIHVVYRVHDSNSSGAALDPSADKQRRLVTLMIDGYRLLPQRLHHIAGRRLSFGETVALRKRISSQYFWMLGYSLCWSKGERSAAIRHFISGLLSYPFCARCWKTLLLSLLRCAFFARPPIS